MSMNNEFTTANSLENYMIILRGMVITCNLVRRDFKEFMNASWFWISVSGIKSSSDVVKSLSEVASDCFCSSQNSMERVSKCCQINSRGSPAQPGEVLKLLRWNTCFFNNSYQYIGMWHVIAQPKHTCSGLYIST